MPSAHAKLSPSSAERWLTCPASVPAAEAWRAEHPEAEDGSRFALEGTLAHELAELEAGFIFALISKPVYQRRTLQWRALLEAAGFPDGTEADMRHHVRRYVNLLDERRHQHPNTAVMLEQSMDTGVPESWGTSDAVLVSPRHIEIIDFKYGAGVRVEAEGNPQLSLYGLGALDTFGDIFGDTETVTMTVHQPRVGDSGHTSSWTITPDELKAWRSEVAIPAALRTREEGAEFNPSPEACRWCPISGVCVARMRAATLEDFGDILEDGELEKSEPATMTPEEIGAALGRTAELRAWATALEATALEMAYSHGVHIPGWKVIMSGGKRQVVDPDAAVKAFAEVGVPETAIATRDLKLKTLAVLDKVAKSVSSTLAEIQGDNLIRTTGRESLVPESAPGVAIDAASTAAADFGEAS